MVVVGEGVRGRAGETRWGGELEALLYALLERDGHAGALSDEEWRFARRGYSATLAHNALVRETLGEVLDVAAAQAIDVLPLKGALLAFTVYPDPGMRPMGDV